MAWGVLFPAVAMAQSVTPPVTPTPAASDCTQSAEMKACLAANVDKNTCQTVICLFAVLNDPKNDIPTPWYGFNLTKFQKKVFDESNPNEIFGERYTQAQVNWIIQSLISTILPHTENSSQTLNLFKLFESITGKVAQGSPIEFQEALALGPMGMVGYVGSNLYASPVASGREEIMGLAQKFNVVQPAYAQGVGYEKLGAGNIKALWTATRNIAYLLVVVLLIASGFMVMFRTKISPQAVVTVEMIIPKLVMSLILITFSYAIVGFVIDLLYVAIVLFLGLFAMTVPGGTALINNSAINPGLTGTINVLTGADTVFVVNTFLLGFINWAKSLIFTTLVLQAGIGAALGTTTLVVPSAIAGALAPIIMPIMGILIAGNIWAIYLAFKMIAQLVTAYVTLIMLTISGPLQIMMDVIPGRKTSAFVGWLKCVVGNASVFFVYAVMVVVAVALFGLTGTDSNKAFPAGTFSIPNVGSKLFTLPFIGADNAQDLPLIGRINIGANFFDMGGVGTQTAVVIMSAIYFSMIPKVASSVKNMFCKSAEADTKFVDDVVKELQSNVMKTASDGSKAAEGAVRTLRRDPNAK